MRVYKTSINSGGQDVPVYIVDMYDLYSVMDEKIKG